MKRENNNWCCEITTKTFKLFREKKLYENVWERNDIFHYWGEIDLEKQFCKKCQKIVEKEKSRFEADAKKEEENLRKLGEEGNCDNCGKLFKKNKTSRWVYRWCGEHGKNDNCVVMERVFCSLKCSKVAEDGVKQYWLQKATIRELNQEIWKREKLHKKIFTDCMDCRKETNQWDEEEIENATCPDCSADLIKRNKKWDEDDKKKKIECSKCGKTKLLGYRKNYYTIYCVDCAPSYKEWRSKHFWFCADDCPQK